MRAARTDPSRLVVPDVLRGFAIIAMLVAHAAPLLSALPRIVRGASSQLNDVASPLFALVMGMSAQIVIDRTPRERRGVMLLQQFARGLILVALGLWMSGWGSWVAIVLSQLGLLLIVGTPLLLLRSRWVALIAIAVLALSAPVNAWARETMGGLYADEIGLYRVLADWAFLGHSYRLTNLLPFFLAGALLLRHGFARDRLLLVLAVTAPAAYLARPLLTRALNLPVAVSGSYLDTLHDVGLVCAVYVAVVWLARVDAPRARSVVAAVFLPLRAIGAVALSLYLAHVALIAGIAQLGLHGAPPNPVVAWIILVPGMVLAGVLWWRFVGPGPVEWLIGAVTRRRPQTRHAGDPESPLAPLASRR